MGNKLYYAIKDIWRNLTSIILFIGQLTIAIFFIFLSSTQMLSNQQYKNNIEKLTDFNLTNFNVYYSVENMKVTSEIRQMMIGTLDNSDHAYSSIDTLQIPKYPNLEAVIGLGEFGRIFGLEQEQIDTSIKDLDTRVLIGSNVNVIDVGDTIKIGLTESEELVVSNRLPKKTSYLKRGGINSLDESIVVLTTLEKFNQLYYDYYIEDSITNMSFINASSGQINEFMKVISESEKLSLSPKKFNINALTKYKEKKDNTIFYIVFFLSMVVFTVMGIVSNLLILVDHNLQEYAIHRLYGATLGEIYLRTIIYVMVIVVSPIIFATILLRSFRLVDHVSYFIIILIIFIVTTLLSIIPINKLKKQDMTFYLRRDY